MTSQSTTISTTISTSPGLPSRRVETAMEDDGEPQSPLKPAPLRLGHKGTTSSEALARPDEAPRRHVPGQLPSVSLVISPRASQNPKHGKPTHEYILSSSPPSQGGSKPGPLHSALPKTHVQDRQPATQSEASLPSSATKSAVSKAAVRHRDPAQPTVQRSRGVLKSQSNWRYSWNASDSTED